MPVEQTLSDVVLRNAGVEGIAGTNPVVTHDFVHFVVHLAANSTGDCCDMCRAKGPIQYA